jgi:hypothetical protein
MSEFHTRRSLRSGDFTVVKHMRANDEIGRLARVDSAVEQLNARFRTMTEERGEGPAATTGPSIDCDLLLIP